MNGQRNKNRNRSRSSPATRRPNKDTLQFAPNFTAYVLPPDVVSLYSEDRKFFLHGELYCALASAIGKNGKSAADLVRELGRNFPPDNIEEALKRLIERRYLVQAPQSSDRTVEGYWASLGLPPDVAEKNLGNCRVLRRIVRCERLGAIERRTERARRQHRQAFTRSDGYAGERLSRAAACGTEPAARVGQDAVVACAAVRRFSAGGTCVQAG